MNLVVKSSHLFFFCDLRDICVNPRKRRAGFLCEPRDIYVNPEMKSSHLLFFYDLSL